MFPFTPTIAFYSYESDIIQGILKKNEEKLVRYFNLTFRYNIDDVLSLNNSTFGDFGDRIYPAKNETLQQKRLFKFTHCEMSFDIHCIYTIYSNTIWGIYLSVEQIFQCGGNACGS